MINLFSKEFIELDQQKIIDEVNQKGYFSFSEAVNLDVVKKIENELSNKDFGVNSNFVSPVWCNGQYFFTHALANCKTYYDLITNINMLPFKKNLKFVKNAIKSGLINGIKNLVKIFLSHDQIVRIATKNKLKK